MFSKQQLLLTHLCRESCLQAGSTSSLPAAGARCTAAACRGKLPEICSKGRTMSVHRSLENQFRQKKTRGVNASWLDTIQRFLCLSEDAQAVCVRLRCSHTRPLCLFQMRIRSHRTQTDIRLSILRQKHGCLSVCAWVGVHVCIWGCTTVLMCSRQNEGGSLFSPSTKWVLGIKLRVHVWQQVLLYSEPSL